MNKVYWYIYIYWILLVGGIPTPLKIKGPDNPTYQFLLMITKQMRKWDGNGRKEKRWCKTGWVKEPCVTVLRVQVCVHKRVKELYVTKLCVKDCVCERDVCDKVLCERVVRIHCCKCCCLCGSFLLLLVLSLLLLLLLCQTTQDKSRISVWSKDSSKMLKHNAKSSSKFFLGSAPVFRIDSRKNAALCNCSCKVMARRQVSTAAQTLVIIRYLRIGVTTPAAQSEGRCRQVPCLPRKQPRRPRRQLGTKRATRTSPVPWVPRLPRKV